MTDSGFQGRKPGRPRAIPLTLVAKVKALYGEGLGYRRIANELEKYGLAVDYTTVRRLIKASTAQPEP